MFQKSRFVDKAYSISFRNSINDYKPNVLTNFTAEILDANKKPASFVAVQLRIDELHVKRELLTDRNGMISYGLIVSDDGHTRQITIRLTTVEPLYLPKEQSSASHVLQRFENNGLPYLLIEDLRPEYLIGDTVRVRLNYSDRSTSMLPTTHCFVGLSNGQIVFMLKPQSDATIVFPVTESLMPGFALTCITHDQPQSSIDLMSSPRISHSTTSMTGDSKRARVVENDHFCGLDIALNETTPNRGGDIWKEFEPGSKATLTVRKGSGEQLSLIGIDEAVLNLGTSKLADRESLHALTDRIRQSCGAAGGLDAGDLLLNNGLFLLDSNSGNHTSTNIGSHCRPPTTRIEEPKNEPKQASAITRVMKNRRRNRRSLPGTFHALFKRNLIHQSPRLVSNISLLHAPVARAMSDMSPRARSCCKLAFRQHHGKQQWDCDTDSLVLIKHLRNDTECIEAYRSCCRQMAPVTSMLRHKSPSLHEITATRFSVLSVSAVKSDFVHISNEERLESGAMIRSDFRETWLFDVHTLSSDSEKITVKLPDSIGTLSLSMLVLSERRGVCIFGQKPQRIRVLKKLFIQLSLPYKAVQNEQLEAVVSVFNLHPQPVPVLLYYFGMNDICSQAAPGEKSDRYQLSLGANDVQSISVPLVPLRSGRHDFKVVALSLLHSDIVKKELLVVPQGIPVEDDHSFQLDPQNRQKRRKRLIATDTFSDRIYPEQNLQVTRLKLIPEQKQQLVVPNSERCVISAIADEFGPALEHTMDSGASDNGSGKSLQHLIRKPRGCGEQTAFYYAPTLYTLKYLQYTRRLDAGLKERARSYLIAGYQRQLMFRKDDGSFAAFPNRASSVWLTAFIGRLLCQSQPYVQVDSHVLISLLQYLVTQQHPTGYWVESYPVVHRQLIGGISGRTQLSAYVLGTLSECEQVETVALELSGQLQDSIRRAGKFLLQSKAQLLRGHSTYKLALVAYGLLDSKQQNDVALQLLQRLADMATFDADRNMISWTDEHPIEVAAYTLLTIAGLQRQSLLYRQNRKSGSTSVMNATDSLTTNATDARSKAYIEFLQEQTEERQKLIMLQLNNLLKKLDAQAIANYLIAQRTFAGGYDSTQDTILALNALAEHYRNQQSLQQLDMQLNCNITTSSKRFARSIEFNRENALVMRKLQLEKQQLNELLNEEIQFATSGNGYGVVSVKLVYNVIAPEKLCKFDLDVQLKDWRERPETTNRHQKSNNSTTSSSNTSQAENEEDQFLDEFPEDLLKELNIRNQAKARPRSKRDVKHFAKEFAELRRRDDRWEATIRRLVESDSNDFVGDVGLNTNQSIKPIRSKRQAESIGRDIGLNSIRVANGDAVDNMKLLTDGGGPAPGRIDTSAVSRAIYELKICAQHIPHQDSEMTIVEVGLLTGFTVEKRELNALVSNNDQNSAGGLIAKYELTPRSVIFYLDSVPFARPVCFEIKLYQSIHVSNIQSAVIKVYDYYKKGKHC